MCKPLPTGGHRWLSGEEINGLHDRITSLQGLSPDGDKGWVLGVDLEYSDRLHDLHNLPLAPTVKGLVGN